MAYYLAFPLGGALYLDSAVILSGHFSITVDIVWTYNGENGQKMFDSPGGSNRFDIHIAPTGTFDNRNYMSVRVDGVLGSGLQSGVRHTVEIFRDASHGDQNPKELQWVGKRYTNSSGLYYLQSDVYGFKIENPTGTITNNYLPTYPDGTGTIWVDSVSGNTARQQNTWPSDNSEWVFYSTGGIDFIESLSPNTATAELQISAIAAGNKSNLTATLGQSSLVNLSQATGYSDDALIVTGSAQVQTLDDVTGASIDFGALPASANSMTLSTVAGHADILALTSSQSSEITLDQAAGHSDALTPILSNAQAQLLDIITGMVDGAETLTASSTGITLVLVAGAVDQLIAVMSPTVSSASVQSLQERIGQIQALQAETSEAVTVDLNIQAGSVVSLVTALSAELVSSELLQFGIKAGYSINAAPVEAVTGTLTLTETTGQVVTLDPVLATASGTNLQLLTGVIIGSFRRSSIIDVSPRYSAIDQTTRYSIEEV